MINGLPASSPAPGNNTGWVSGESYWTAAPGVTSAVVSVKVQCSGTALYKEYGIDDISFVQAANVDFKR